MKVYLIIVSSGHYDAFETRIETGFFKQEDAQTFVDEWDKEQKRRRVKNREFAEIEELEIK